MNNTYFGGDWVLNELPIWVTAFILYMVTIGVLFILRDKFEGLFYNTSYASQLGDGALSVIVLMAAGILQRGASLPEWAQSWWFDIGAFILGSVLGTVWWLLDRPQQWGDIYHHLVIAPLLCYLGITLLPIIWLSGTHVENYSTLTLILLWAVLVVYDIKTKRLNQREYFGLGEHLGTIWLKRWQSS